MLAAQPTIYRVINLDSGETSAMFGETQRLLAIALAGKLAEDTPGERWGVMLETLVHEAMVPI